MIRVRDKGIQASETDRTPSYILICRGTPHVERIELNWCWPGATATSCGCYPLVTKKARRWVLEKKPGRGVDHYAYVLLAPRNAYDTWSQESPYLTSEKHTFFLGSIAFLLPTCKIDIKRHLNVFELKQLRNNTFAATAATCGKTAIFMLDHP